jgi:hypothetical protein
MCSCLGLRPVPPTTWIRRRNSWNSQDTRSSSGCELRDDSGTQNTDSTHCGKLCALCLWDKLSGLCCYGTDHVESSLCLILTNRTNVVQNKLFHCTTSSKLYDKL